MKGVVYTETLIHSAPEAFVSEAPYQLILVTLEDGTRLTGRVVQGERVAIDDRVVLAEHRNEVPFFRKGE
jgi:uncharacterized OB-fold protein